MKCQSLFSWKNKRRKIKICVEFRPIPHFWASVLLHYSRGGGSVASGAYTLGWFSDIFCKCDNFCNFPFGSQNVNPLLLMGFTLNGNNLSPGLRRKTLLSGGTSSFVLVSTFCLQKGAKTEFPPMNVYPIPFAPFICIAVMHALCFGNLCV